MWTREISIAFYRISSSGKKAAGSGEAESPVLRMEGLLDSCGVRFPEHHPVVRTHLALMSTNGTGQEMKRRG
jgi:hypothetical protein